MANTTRKNRKKQSSWKKVSHRRAFTVTTKVAGMPAFLTVADESAEKAVTTYIDAHKLLPRTSEEAVRTQQPTIAEALAILEDEQAGAGAVLHAIVILGHTPEPLAHKALKHYAASNRVHAEVAWVAADECSSWMGDFGKTPEMQASQLN
jgi:hypothetical protein